ncbi:hypothetical protein [Streptacidiphilus sp. MAP12-20]|uniref:hypothetical protein n=1 Tax=Streptacidiphilus sp. MAP12-20 TaxID=3156299 RepID=UPI003516DC01
MHVRIATDGSCFIDDEFFPVPPGASLNEAVLRHLALEAAALEAPVRALIHDEQADYTVEVEVRPDGASLPIGHPETASIPSTVSANLPGDGQDAGQPWIPKRDSQQLADPSTTWEPVRPDRPYEPLVEPYRTRLVNVLSLARGGDLAMASRSADELIGELSAIYASTHVSMLAALTVRGDLAHLSGDFQYGLQLWSFVARLWGRELGSKHPSTVRAAGNAVGCWRQLGPADAVTTSRALIELLNQVPIPRAEIAHRLIESRTKL